jgi:hypothetical protein
MPRDFIIVHPPLPEPDIDFFVTNVVRDESDCKKIIDTIFD